MEINRCPHCVLGESVLSFMLAPRPETGHCSLGCNALLRCLWALCFHSPGSLAQSLLLIISAISRRTCCGVLPCRLTPSPASYPTFHTRNPSPEASGLCSSPRKDNHFSRTISFPPIACVTHVGRKHFTAGTASCQLIAQTLAEWITTPSGPFIAVR